MRCDSCGSRRIRPSKLLLSDLARHLTLRYPCVASFTARGNITASVRCCFREPFVAGIEFSHKTPFFKTGTSLRRWERILG